MRDRRTFNIPGIATYVKVSNRGVLDNKNLYAVFILDSLAEAEWKIFRLKLKDPECKKKLSQEDMLRYH